MSVHAPGAVLWHGESILRGDERVGHLTSGAIAPTLGGSAGLGWVHGDLEGDGWGVEIRGEVVPATVQRRTVLRPARRPTAELSVASPRFTFLGVPIDSVGRAGGTEFAPQAIREASGDSSLWPVDAGDLDVTIRGDDRDPVTGIIASEDVLHVTREVRPRRRLTARGRRRPRS